jgi:hypothetical protein
VPHDSKNLLANQLIKTIIRLFLPKGCNLLQISVQGANRGFWRKLVNKKGLLPCGEALF